MVFQSGEPSTEESSSNTPSKTFKTKFKLLGWLFGNPLQTFDNLIPAKSPSTSGSSSADISMPTDQNILQHWIYLVDESRDSLRMSDEFYVSITYDVVDNLIAFWELYSSEELRYVIKELKVIFPKHLI